MEERKYHIDESKVAGDKVCEPSPVYASVASESVSHHMIDSGIEQKDEIPVLKNHFSYEGLLDSLDYCETIRMIRLNGSLLMPLMNVYMRNSHG